MDQQIQIDPSDHKVHYKQSQQVINKNGENICIISLDHESNIDDLVNRLSELIGVYERFSTYTSNALGCITLHKASIKLASAHSFSQNISSPYATDSVLQSLVLAGCSISMLDRFLESHAKCSEIITKTAQLATGSGFFMLITSTFCKLIFGINVTNTLTDITATILTLGGIIGQGITSTTPIRPNPYYLSEYINKNLLHSSEYSKTKVLGYDSFANCTRKISHAIKTGRPVIVCFPYKPTIWHCVNVVAMQGVEDHFIILIKEVFRLISNSNLEKLMRNDHGVIDKGSIGRYTIICFYTRKFL